METKRKKRKHKKHTVNSHPPAHWPLPSCCPEEEEASEWSSYTSAAAAAALPIVQVDHSPPILDSTTVYFFFSRPYSTLGAVSYSLWAVDLLEPMPPPKPILKFSPWESFRLAMTCIKFKSKFYFLGGQINYNHQIGYDQIGYPRDVRVFDPVSSSFCYGPPMHSGKRSPSYFIANDCLYVLGSHINPIEEEQSPCPINYFEMFDGVRWTVLPNPPIKCALQSWIGCTVLDSKTVHVVGTNCFSILFNLDSKSWISLHIPPSCPLLQLFINWTILARAQFVGGYFYSVGIDGVISKWGPYTGFHDLFEFHKQAAIDVSRDWGSLGGLDVSSSFAVDGDDIDGDDIDALAVCDFTDLQAASLASSGTYVIRPLGDKRFCFIETGAYNIPQPLSCCSRCGSIIDREVFNRRYFRVLCFGDTSPFKSPHHDYGFIFSAEDFGCGGFLEDCHILGFEEKNALLA